MTTGAAELPSGTTLDARLAALTRELVKVAAGILGAGALVFYAWNWGVAPAFTFLRPLDGFWMGPMLVAGLFFIWTVFTAIRTDEGLSLSLDSFDELVAEVAPLAGLLVLFWAVHHYLV